MKQIFYTILGLMLTCSVFGSETVVWTGKVNSNGRPTDSVKLEIGGKYRVRAFGEINLGKWWQQKHPLANDACYEFSDLTAPPVRTKFPTLKNSLEVSVCDGKYHEDHIYQSEPFTVTQSVIHFWIHDTNYDDNTGDLTIEILKVANSK